MEGNGAVPKTPEFVPFVAPEPPAPTVTVKEAPGVTDTCPVKSPPAPPPPEEPAAYQPVVHEPPPPATTRYSNDVMPEGTINVPVLEKT